MKVYIVFFYDESFDNQDLVIIRKVFSKKDKAEQYIREKYGLSDDANVYDEIEEMWSLSGTRLDIREYEIDGEKEN